MKFFTSAFTFGLLFSAPIVSALTIPEPASAPALAPAPEKRDVPDLGTALSQLLTTLDNTLSNLQTVLNDVDVRNLAPATVAEINTLLQDTLTTITGLGTIVLTFVSAGVLPTAAELVQIQAILGQILPIVLVLLPILTGLLSVAPLVGAVVPLITTLSTLFSMVLMHTGAIGPLLAILSSLTGILGSLPVPQL
ncbi:hypothetical protein TWF696_003669 [Orbilia brochopaga]|uniref:Uncharacterized protein n=1 Tax=Orbilia brochopaga TaxID=3140254 RepID=A0AAV9VAB0_9PEZI